ncbi:MAG: MBL fold metallo-hydrolase, partial [Nitrospinota bacterium]
HLVVYTHLHNDHVGASHLFKRARHIFQRDEWMELVNPLPFIKFRGDFDPAAIPIFEGLDCYRIEGDLSLLPGLTIYKNPGHTAGGQILAIETEGGTYVISGDTLISNHNAFPGLREITGIDGETIPITPVPEGYGPAIPSIVTSDCYDWYDSVAQIKSLLKGPEFLIAGHEPSLVGKSFP